MKQFVGLVSTPNIGVSNGDTPIVHGELTILTEDTTYYRGDSMLLDEVKSELGAIVCSVSREGIRSAVEALLRLDATLKDLEERITIEPKLTMDDEEAAGC